MANLKEYQIKINGIQETINAVDSLNKQLETLESRIKALEGKAVNISSGGGASLPKASELSEIEKIENPEAVIEEEALETEEIAKELYTYENIITLNPISFISMSERFFTLISSLASVLGS